MKLQKKQCFLSISVHWLSILDKLLATSLVRKQMKKQDRLQKKLLMEAKVLQNLIL